MTEKDKGFMRRAIELSEKTSLVDKAGGVFGTVIVDKNGQNSVRRFQPRGRRERSDLAWRDRGDP